MRLVDFFTKYPKVAIAFSGGVDSAYLLYAAKKYAKEVVAYYVKTAFQPQFEWEDAKRLSEELDVAMTTITLDILADETIASNPRNRCYYCKRHIFDAIKKQALRDGYSILLDGTNASDDVNDRPGMKALKELEVLSPLRMCGLTKEEIRILSKEASLFTWDKPAYACLATRVPTGEVITEDKLKATECAESYLHSLGFVDFRVRCIGTIAKIQVPEYQIRKVLEHRTDIVSYLKQFYSSVLLDLEARE